MGSNPTPGIHRPRRITEGGITSELAGRVGIVTGASSGIGHATARRLAAAGMAVVLFARREAQLTSLAADIDAAGGRALVVAGDVTDRASARAMAATTEEALGFADTLVNNAGVMLLSPVRERREDEWDRMLDVNVRGLLTCTAAVLPGMLARGSGHIVNVGSLAGRRPFPGGTIYSATKFAVRAISAGLRAELSPGAGIRVTDVEPGVVRTELTDHIAHEPSRAGFERRWSGKRALDADDVARAILYAVSQPPHVNVNEILVRPTEQDT